MLCKLTFKPYYENETVSPTLELKYVCSQGIVSDKPQRAAQPKSSQWALAL